VGDRAAPEPGHQHRVVDQPAQARGPVAGLVGVDEEPAHAVTDHGGEAADRGGDHRGAGGLRLDGDEPERLVVGRDRDRGGGGGPHGELGLAHRRDEADDVTDAEVGGQVGQGGGVLEPGARRPAHDGYDEPVPQRRVLLEQHPDRSQQHVGRLERLDATREEQDGRVLGQPELAPGLRAPARREDGEVDARVDHLDVVGAGVVEVDELAGLGVGVGDEQVGGLHDLLLADHAGEGLGRVALGEGLVLDLGHRVHRVDEGDVPAVTGQRSDLAGEPVVGVDGVVVAQRLHRLGTQHLAGERAQLTGQLDLRESLERARGHVAHEHAVRRFDDLRERGGGGPGEDVDRDALLGQAPGELDHIDVHPTGVARPGLVQR
jgi:hypothetical protein